MPLSSPTTSDRSLFVRFRFAAALLAVLVAVDVGLAFQNSWSRHDDTALEQEQSQEIREALDAIDRRRAEVTEINHRALKIIDEKLSRKSPVPAAGQPLATPPATAPAGTAQGAGNKKPAGAGEAVETSERKKKSP